MGEAYSNKSAVCSLDPGIQSFLWFAKQSAKMNHLSLYLLNILATHRQRISTIEDAANCFRREPLIM